ncbi:MAG: transposase [Acidisphaera sp.]|nr:transposase [Acidisphaera sp.]
MTNRRAILRRLGLGKLSALQPGPAIVRYQRDTPGELIIDGIGHRITGDRKGQSSKRGTGWEYLHIAIASAYRDLLRDLGLRHKRTRPYTPRTNGKAERFIQTSLRQWAYASAYQSSAERTDALLPWLTTYNTARSHTALSGQPPLTWLTNLPGFDT